MILWNSVKMLSPGKKAQGRLCRGELAPTAGGSPFHPCSPRFSRGPPAPGRFSAGAGSRLRGADAYGRLTPGAAVVPLLNSIFGLPYGTDLTARPGGTRNPAHLLGFRGLQVGGVPPGHAGPGHAATKRVPRLRRESRRLRATF